MLFTPIDVCSLRIRNRLVLAPMDTELNSVIGEVTDRMIAYYAERAAGGIGLIITEFTAIDAVQRLTSPGIYSDRFIAGWERLTERVHSYGAKIILQIAHHGGRAVSQVTGVKPVAPSAIKSPLYPEMPRALSELEIEAIIESFTKAAKRGEMAGFDGVEIHAGHGYLLGEFISPHTNRRDDAFGGDFEKRMHVPAQILKGIRNITHKGFPVGLKFSAYECLEDGIDITLGRHIATYMERCGIDYLHVSALSFPLPETRYFSVPPVYTLHPPLVELAARIKEVVNIPIIAVGGIGTREEAENVLKEGSADLVAIGRAMIADPQLPSKWKNGNLVRACIRCNRCHTRIMEQKTLRCAVNPMAGRETEHMRMASHPKRIIVVGGGPAGVMAAVTASERGHEVHLFESRNTLGGKTIAGSLPSFKEPFRRFLTWLNHWAANSTVNLYLGENATPDRVLKYAPDHVILATGGKQHPFPVAGKKLIDSITAFERGVTLPDRILVVGAGMVGCEIACYLSELGKTVILADVMSEEQLMKGEHFFNRLALLQMVREQVAEVHLGAGLIIEEDPVRIDGTQITADTIINATGFVQNSDLVKEYMNALDSEMLSIIGDEKTSSDVYAAVQDAFATAITI